MTDQLDWADEASKAAWMTPGNIRENYASALRTAFKRGEVAGMRRAAHEALKIANQRTLQNDFASGGRYELKTLGDRLRTQADQIEKGL